MGKVCEGGVDERDAGGVVKSGWRGFRLVPECFRCRGSCRGQTQRAPTYILAHTDPRCAVTSLRFVERDATLQLPCTAQRMAGRQRMYRTMNAPSSVPHILHRRQW